jgi:PDZ domain
MRRIALLLGSGILAGSLLPQSRGASVPADPGMYVTTSDGVSKIIGQIITFKRTGSLFVSGLTGGIKTRKENIQLLGAHAETVTDATPVFYFVLAKQEADTGVNAGDLVLIRLEEKSKRRQFEVGARGLWRGSSGISITHQVQVFRSEEQPGVYKIMPSNPLKKGEYALYATRGNGLAPYVYDFSVEGENVGTRSTYQPEITPRRNAAEDGPADSVAQVAASEKAPAAITTPVKEPPTPLPNPAAVDAAVPSTNPDANSPMATGNPVVGLDQELSIGAWFSGKLTERHDGVEVAGVRHGGAVDEIGVKAGDFILAIDDHYVFTIQELHSVLLSHGRDSRVGIRYRRHSLIYDTFIKIGPSQH